MPITPYLDDFDVNAETKRVLSAALEETRISLGLGDNFADGIIAKRIVELARQASEIPLSCVKAQSRNYAGICSETNRGDAAWVAQEAKTPPPRCRLRSIRTC